MRFVSERRAPYTSTQLGLDGPLILLEFNADHFSNATMMNPRLILTSGSLIYFLDPLR